MGNKVNHEISPHFLGYHRVSGRPGVRNHLLVLNLTGLTAPSARHIAAALPHTRLVSMPHGTAFSQRGEALVEATLAGMARHPNAGAVLVLCADTKKAESFRDMLGKTGRPIEVLSLAETGRDAVQFRSEAVRRGARLLAAISRQRREPFPWSELVIGLECGMSDPSSGLGANPLLGAVVDRLVGDGGAAILGETLEWLGSEDRLAERAVTPEIGRRIRESVLRREAAATEGGIDLLGNNPNPANIAAGLTTIEDKAIGSVSKSGSVPVTAFLDYGEAFSGPGLAVMDGPSYTPESLTGLVASGAQIALFTSGVGNSYVSSVAPTLKITANGMTEKRLPEQFDFTCSEVMERPETFNEVRDALISRVVEVASGALTYGEIFAEGDEVISRFGETL